MLATRIGTNMLPSGYRDGKHHKPLDMPGTSRKSLPSTTHGPDAWKKVSSRMY